MKAFIFPGQGSQFKGMGKDLFESSEEAKKYFSIANKIMGFDISAIMFEGSDEELKETKVTQPAVFIHSVIAALLNKNDKPEMVAGHSLGEFSALVSNQCLSFEDALELVKIRAFAMQKACEIMPGTMAAVLKYESDEQVEKICASITEEIVVAANYNCPGQLVISGSLKGIDLAAEKLTVAGVRRVLKLQVGGAFHSPLMEPARAELAQAINSIQFANPICPIIQNATAKSTSSPIEIKENLIAQLTSPVKWTQSVLTMISLGAQEFMELGPGNVLQGLVSKIDASVKTSKG